MTSPTGVRPNKFAPRRPVEPSFGRRGFRNPSRALKSLGAMALAVEALVLLLAIQPIRILEDGISARQLTALVGASVAAILITGLLHKRIGWWLAAALQVVLVACGALHWLLGVVGVVFGLLWLYVGYVRRRVML